MKNDNERLTALLLKNDYVKQATFSKTMIYTEQGSERRSIQFNVYTTERTREYWEVREEEGVYRSVWMYNEDEDEWKHIYNLDTPAYFCN